MRYSHHSIDTVQIEDAIFSPHRCFCTQVHLTVGSLHLGIITVGCHHKSWKERAASFRLEQQLSYYLSFCLGNVLT